MIRLLLDAHYSFQRIGAPLAAEGLDVRAAVNDPVLHHAADADVLDIAILEQRILVTADTGHFSELLQQSAAIGREHAGVILVPSTIRNDAYGLILRSLRHVLVDGAGGADVGQRLLLNR
ncbi:MAG: DUF5615 family PIN-like protein [Thermomicrobiales bacterium]